MNKKKILLVSDVKGWGGWVRGQYIKKYLSNEFDFDLVDNEGFDMIERKLSDVFTVNDVKKFTQINNDKEVFLFNKFRNYVNSQKQNIKKYDLIYLLFHTMLVKKNVKRLMGNVKIITIVTGFPTVKPIFQNKTNFHKFSKGCEAIGANNLLSLEDLKKHYNGKTFCATRGVDENIFYPMSSKPKRDNEQLVAAYVGKPIKEKGLKDIIIPACREAGVKLIINDRNYTNALSPNKMREFYNQADFYIVASTIDGTPNPALEAAACGKPIISNHIGNMPEFIKNNYNGFIIHKDNGTKINKFVNFIQNFKNDKQKCFEMGMNARKTILENWTWKKVTESERKIFKEVLNVQ